MSVVSVSRALKREPSSHSSHVYFIILQLNFFDPRCKISFTSRYIILSRLYYNIEIVVLSSVILKRYDCT